MFKSNIKIDSNSKLSEQSDEEKKLNISEDEILKFCINRGNRNYEKDFYDIISGNAKLWRYSYFRPVEKKASKKIEKLGSALTLKKIDGFSVFDVMYYINKASNRNDKIVEAIIQDSVNSIKEFWKICSVKDIYNKLKSKEYEYAKKLEDSYKDIEEIIYYPDIVKDLKILGKNLESYIDKQSEDEKRLFRDAHLKNRIWKHENAASKENLEKKAEIFANELLGSSDDAVKKYLENIYDIDFETVGYYVTPWEDGIHILFFEYSSYDPTFEDNDPIRKYNEYFDRITDEKAFLETLLARSFRELCRRIWYFTYMPNTFNERYGKETPRYFCDLGIHALEKLMRSKVEYNYISKFLKDKVTMIDEIFKTKHEIINQTYKMEKVKLFISYSHEDEDFKNELTHHLSGLKRSGLVEEWHDRYIKPSEPWDEEIKKNLNEADIILLLISSDFIYSDYINDIEINNALERYKKKDVKIIPVVIRTCDFSSLSISSIQALPKDAKPVKTWDDRDEAWLNVINGIKSIIKKGLE